MAFIYSRKMHEDPVPIKLQTSIKVFIPIYLFITSRKPSFIVNTQEINVWGKSFMWNKLTLHYP